MNYDYYLLFLWNDVEPQLHGPFPTENIRDEKAKELRQKEGEEHGYFPLEITTGSEITVNSYPGSFFEG